VTRGKAWSVEEVLRLKELVEAGVPISGIAVCLSKSRAAVGNKLSHLGLRDGGFRGGLGPSSSREGLELPVDLPTVEDAAKVLAGAMLAMAKPGVDRKSVV